MQVLLFDDFNGIAVGLSGLITLFECFVAVTEAYEAHEVSLLLRLRVRLQTRRFCLRGRTIQFLHLFVQIVETSEVSEGQLIVILYL